MKTLLNYSLIPIMLFILSCHSGSKQQPVTASTDFVDSDNIEVYYFHFTARCVTCRTIEADTRKNLESLYPQQTKAGLISFKSLNLDEETTREIAGKLGISGQTLLFVRGGQKINLTNEGFMYAVSKPEKFKEIINEKVELLLSR